MSRPLLEAALDDALVRGLMSGEQLLRRLDALGQHGRVGTRALAALIDARMGAPRWTQSEFERRLFSLLRRSGIPLPVPQYEVRLPGEGVAFLDLAWPERLLALEANSYRWHAGRLAWARDNTRNSALTSLGWRILPVTWDQVVERPDELLALVQRAHAA